LRSLRRGKRAAATKQIDLSAGFLARIAGPPVTAVTAPAANRGARGKTPQQNRPTMGQSRVDEGPAKFEDSRHGPRIREDVSWRRWDERFQEPTISAKGPNNDGPGWGRPGRWRTWVGNVQAIQPRDRDPNNEPTPNAADLPAATLGKAFSQTAITIIPPRPTTLHDQSKPGQPPWLARLNSING